MQQKDVTILNMDASSNIALKAMKVENKKEI